jgi:hypothetical protein
VVHIDLLGSPRRSTRHVVEQAWWDPFEKMTIFVSFLFVMGLMAAMLFMVGCIQPTPKPSPSPTVEPTATPVPTPTPVVSACPKALEPGAYVYVTNKPYGQGLDAGVRVKGDREMCRLIHGVDTDDCHFEGWGKRAECEMELMGGCPVWQYSTDGKVSAGACRQAEHPIASCDHFGDPTDRDDPQTPAFEGKPAACGLQRDPRGDPMAGFFVIAHGNAYFRACIPDGSQCAPWLKVNH